MTIPLLHGLIESYSERRRRELHEEGVAAALAAHDPSGLQALRSPSEANGEPESDMEFEPAPWS